MVKMKQLTHDEIVYDLLRRSVPGDKYLFLLEGDGLEQIPGYSRNNVDRIKRYNKEECPKFKIKLKMEKKINIPTG